MPVGRDRPSKARSDASALEGENWRLKQQVQHLRQELMEKNSLIASLEAQIKSLIKEGDLSNGKKGSTRPAASGGLPPMAPSSKTSSSTNKRKSGKSGDDSDDDAAQPPPTGDRKPSLEPPSRREVEMSSPLPAPRLLNREDVLASWDGTLMTESIEDGEDFSRSNESQSRSNGSHKNTIASSEPPSEASVVHECHEGSRRQIHSTQGAIKALPRELSIFNADDDDVTKYSIEDNMPSYFLESTEMRDAYNARGLYTGTISRKDQMPHGKGRMKYHHQGRSYEGDWVLGHWHGMGRISNANGDVYEGQVQNDLDRKSVV